VVAQLLAADAAHRSPPADIVAGCAGELGLVAGCAGELGLVAGCGRGLGLGLVAVHVVRSFRGSWRMPTSAAAC
jgi:hypothetical protein